ncbi:Rieske (2Fe-2S) protein [Sporolactobacillus spathodeae]|uniref:Rieske domain-containing protein n=1 Tax=Sporolactobacillus spathodeae TaxID=1465502 RepID=A0ABS2Q693_9BACL|nr:Rieske (2Fe-2S) protein [Sporolactobacillus spathodeae]MBM7657181.1 hypothetical protein [Sporolactobacillus spathodeae]
MDRRSFFKELARSLTETGKEVLSPIIENDLEKIDRASDILQGQRWVPVASPSEGYEEQLVNGQLIGLFREGDQVRAFDKKCPQCRELLQWIAYDQKLHCPECDLSYSFVKKEGALAPSFYAIKKDEQGFWVAFPK